MDLWILINAYYIYSNLHLNIPAGSQDCPCSSFPMQVWSCRVYVQTCLGLPVPSTVHLLALVLSWLASCLDWCAVVCFQHDMFLTGGQGGAGSTNILYPHESQRVFTILSFFALISAYWQKDLNHKSSKMPGSEIFILKLNLGFKISNPKARV